MFCCSPSLDLVLKSNDDSLFIDVVSLCYFQDASKYYLIVDNLDLSWKNPMCVSFEKSNVSRVLTE